MSLNDIIEKTDIPVVAGGLIGDAQRFWQPEKGSPEFTFQGSGTSLDQQSPIIGREGLIDIVRRVSNLERSVTDVKDRFTISPAIINTLSDDRWRLIQPLSVSIENRATDEFIACLYDIDLYGYGDSIPEALSDLKLMMISQFEYLLEEKDNFKFSDIMKKQFAFLNKTIVNENG